jgi:glycosyltransferase involved in cell wall biosynthesis
MVTSQPLVSILVPAYNHEDYVATTLNSILGNSYVNKEVVIINDGSTDETPNIVAEWVKKNCNKIDVIYLSRENLGVVKTLNELISMSNGEYIYCLASDDRLLDGGIEIMVGYLQNHKEKMAVIGDSTLINKESKIIFKSTLKEYFNVCVEKYQSDEKLRNEVILRWSVAGSVFLARKKLYLFPEFSYNEKLQHEDWDMYLKLVSKNYLGFVESCVSEYRIHEANVSRVSHKLVIINRLKVIRCNIFRFNFLDQLKLVYIGIRLSITLILFDFRRFVTNGLML